jgi:hypothetical protein
VSNLIFGSLASRLISSNKDQVVERIIAVVNNNFIEVVGG